MTQQESIPVGCVPPAFVVTGIWGYPEGRVSKGVGYPGVGYTPPEGTWDQRYPLPRKDMGPRTRKEPGTSDTLLLPVDR